LSRDEATSFYRLGSESEVIFATWNFADDIYERICNARRAYTTTYLLSKPVSPEEGVGLSLPD
jgi:HD-like signal output (HDOD) protein